jgi:uncharacterized repeat protein (TIGR03803 family)
MAKRLLNRLTQDEIQRPGATPNRENIIDRHFYFMKRVYFLFKEIFLTLGLVAVIGLILVGLGSDFIIRVVSPQSPLKSISFARPEYSEFRAGLVIDEEGSYYGLSSSPTCSPGALFKISSDGKVRTILHKFRTDSPDEDQPAPGLSLGKDGNLYGITSGSRGPSIFKLSRGGTFQTLFRFDPDGRNGSGLLSLTAASGDKLYGTTSFGGPRDHGTVFALRNDGRDFQILHSFGVGPGEPSLPRASVIVGKSGDLYGTTLCGGHHGGTIFKLRIDGTDFTVIHRFGLSPEDGGHPEAELTLDGEETLYGLTQSGSDGRFGQIYQMNADGSDYRILHVFVAELGGIPYGSLFLGSDKNLYGLSAGGGAHESGNLFRILPTGGFEVIHDFQEDGNFLPSGGAFLTEHRGRLYGAIPCGGGVDHGNVFALPLEKPAQKLVARR